MLINIATKYFMLIVLAVLMAACGGGGDGVGDGGDGDITPQSESDASPTTPTQPSPGISNANFVHFFIGDGDLLKGVDSNNPTNPVILDPNPVYSRPVHPGSGGNPPSSDSSADVAGSAAPFPPRGPPPFHLHRPPGYAPAVAPGGNLRVYKQEDEDNGRWEGFEFRSGDIVIDAPSKSGTTWTQLLVALLVFDGPDFPAPLGQISLWLEKRTRSVEEALADFAAQRHRRFIKSHTPLDGIPIRDEVRYVCVGRDPRDAAVSMMHHSDNMDREVWAELTGQEPPDPESAPPVRTTEERFDGWLDGGPYPDWSARFLLDHYRTFWERRHLPNVALFHFEDYRRDLPGEVLRLASHLDIDITPARAAEVAEEAGIERARTRAADIAPEAHLGIWKDTARFFRSGSSGEWRDVMTPAQQERYEQIVAEEIHEELARWVHHGAG